MSEVLNQAKRLAEENMKSDSSIKEVYWIPHDSEVRLIEISSEVPMELDKKIHPFYFSPSVVDHLPYVSGVALITPGEFGKVSLPPTWGNWESVQRIF
jgi:hypothetical protein